MRSGSIYLAVKDFDRSVDFYEKILEMKVSAANGKRFAVFRQEGLNLCLTNGLYDEQHPEQKKINTAGNRQRHDCHPLPERLFSLSVFQTEGPRWESDRNHGTASGISQTHKKHREGIGT